MASVPKWMTILAYGLVAATIIAIPWNSVSVFRIDDHSPHMAFFLRFALVGVVDVLALSLFVVAMAITVLRRTVTMNLATVGLLLFVVAMVIATVLNPSPEGALKILRVAGTLGAAVVLIGMQPRDYSTFVVWPFTFIALQQSLVGIMQTFVLGSGRSRVDLVGSAETWTAALGSFHHEYEYAAFLIVAMATILSLQRHRRLHPLMWFAVATSSAASAASFGRTALLAVLLVSVVYGIGWMTKRLTPLAWSAATPLAGAALSGVVALPAWQQRASVTSAIRVELMERAIEIIRAHPIVGVGPGQYGRILFETATGEPDRFIVHNIPLLIAAEFGILIGFAFTLWLVAIGVRSVVTSVYAGAIFIAAVPFLLLDNLHYVYPTGLMMFGLWVGLLGYQMVQRPMVTGAPSRSNETTSPLVP
ncbi:O-antigen ligase family protein [Actinomycetota bacterium]